MLPMQHEASLEWDHDRILEVSAQNTAAEPGETPDCFQWSTFYSCQKNRRNARGLLGSVRASRNRDNYDSLLYHLEQEQE